MSTPARHIFVVDDEVMITESLALILRRKGFTVSSFNDPLEALDRIKIAPPDLLISDVMMPQLSGLDLAIQTRELAPDCGILLFSGHALATGMVQRANVAGRTFLILQKPVHPDEFLAEIERLNVRPHP